jgi:hypothetical protein
MKTSLCSEIGFAECTYATDDVYAGQSMLICARTKAARRTRSRTRA